MMIIICLPILNFLVLWELLVINNRNIIIVIAFWSVFSNIRFHSNRYLLSIFNQKFWFFGEVSILLNCYFFTVLIVLTSCHFIPEVDLGQLNILYYFYMNHQFFYFFSHLFVFFHSFGVIIKSLSLDFLSFMRFFHVKVIRELFLLQPTQRYQIHSHQ